MEQNRIDQQAYRVKMIAANGMIAALYAAITIACGPLSYNFLQFRISELLNLLVFFNPYYTIGLTLGCLLYDIHGIQFHPESVLTPDGRKIIENFINK